MEAIIRPPARTPTLEEQVRALGFNPRWLTPREQEELLDIQRRLADAAPRE